MIICFLVGLVAFGATSSNIPYESGYFIPIHNQVVNNLAELTIALNIEMPYLNQSTLQCPGNRTSLELESTITKINNYFRKQFDALSANFGVPIQLLDKIKMHYSNCRIYDHSDRKSFYCGYPELSCCALKSDKKEEIRCVHDSKNKQVWMNVELSHYTSRCYKLATPLKYNFPHKKYFLEVTDRIKINEAAENFNLGFTYLTKFPYDHEQFKRLIDSDIDTTVFLDYIETDDLEIELLPKWKTNKGYSCVGVIAGATTYEDTSLSIRENFEIQTFVNNTIKCQYQDSDIFDSKAFDARFLFFNCPLKLITNIKVKARITENLRLHEIVVHRDNCDNMIKHYMTRQNELIHEDLEPLENLPLNPPVNLNTEMGSGDSIEEKETKQSKPVPKKLTLEEVLALGSTDQNEGSADNLKNVLTDDSDYSEVVSEFVPIDKDLIPNDKRYTYRYVKVRKPRGVFDSITGVLEYYAFGAWYTNLANIRNFQKVDKRLDKLQKILEFNIRGMERLTHNMQTDMSAMTDLICKLGENIETSTMKIKASLMMLDLKTRLSEFYGQCSSSQIPYQYSRYIRQFLCDLDVTGCEKLVKLMKCRVVNVQVTGHHIAQMTLTLQLTVPLVDKDLKVYKRIVLPKLISNQEVEQKYITAEILKKELNSTSKWNPFNVVDRNVSYEQLVYEMNVPKLLVINSTDFTVIGEVEPNSLNDFVLNEDIKQSCCQFFNGSIISDCAKYTINPVHKKCYVKRLTTVKQIYVLSKKPIHVIGKDNVSRQCNMCLLSPSEKTYDCGYDIVNEQIVEKVELDVLIDPLLLDISANWSSYDKLSEQIRYNISILDEKVKFKIGYQMLEALNDKESIFWKVVIGIISTLILIVVAALIYIGIRRVKVCIENREVRTFRESIRLLTNPTLQDT